MKHLIIGCGTVGNATGVWLEANQEDVYYHDVKSEKLIGKKVPDQDDRFDIFWICTAEWSAESVLESLNPRDGIVVVRSTTSPGTIKSWSEKYRIDIFHVPEFLKAVTSTHDIFYPDRVVIGETSGNAENVLKPLFESFYPRVSVLRTDSTSSELIKLTANAWLSTQISFWNEINRLSKKLNLNPQHIANIVTMDNRISEYGSLMFGNAFSGRCLPKDLVALKKAFKDNGLESHLLIGVEKVNECIK